MTGHSRGNGHAGWPHSLGDTIAANAALRGLEVEANRRARRRSVRLDEFLAEVETQAPDRIEGLLPLEGICVLLGAEKAGKSALSLQIALSIASGQPLFDRPARACPVLLIEEEGSRVQLRGRLQKMMPSLGIEGPVPPVHVWHRSRLRLDDSTVVNLMEEEIARHSTGVVILGPLTLLAETADENKSVGVTQVVRNLLDVVARRRVLFILAHHRRKQNERLKGRLSIREFFNSSRGSNALTAAMDVGLGLDRDPGDSRGRVLVMSREKAPEVIPIIFGLDDLTFCVRVELSREEADCKKLLEALKQGPMPVTGAEERLGVSKNTARARLRLLVDNGKASVTTTDAGAEVYCLREDDSQ